MSEQNDEMIRVNIVLNRDGVLTTRVYQHNEVNCAISTTLIAGMLQRSLAALVQERKVEEP